MTDYSDYDEMAEPGDPRDPLRNVFARYESESWLDGAEELDFDPDQPLAA